jgi:hypothetical protein
MPRPSSSLGAQSEGPSWRWPRCVWSRLGIGAFMIGRATAPTKAAATTTTSSSVGQPTTTSAPLRPVSQASADHPWSGWWLYLSPSVTLSVWITRSGNRVAGSLFYGPGVTTWHTQPGAIALPAVETCGGGAPSEFDNGNGTGTASASGTVVGTDGTISLTTPEVLGSRYQETDELTLSAVNTMPVLSLSSPDGTIYPMIQATASTVNFYDKASESCAS